MLLSAQLRSRPSYLKAANVPNVRSDGELLGFLRPNLI